MSEKDVETAPKGTEPTGTGVKSELPGYDDNGLGQHETRNIADSVRQEDFMTRNGLNLKSFQKREYGKGIVELDRSMRGRHLQMIAIGTSLLLTRAGG